MSFGELLLVGAQLCCFLAIGWVFGSILFSRLGIDAASTEAGAPERMLFAVVGGVGFAVAAMVGNIVTGGAVFGIPGVVPVLGIAVLVAGRRTFRFPRALPWLPLIALSALLLALYFAPVLTGGSGVRTGDSPWHLGWSQQLLAGEAVPTGPAPSYGRNAYPWGWHAVIATMVRVVPGSDALLAYEALHLLLLLGIPLGAACLARRLDRAAGWAGAICASAIGGFGWLSAQGATFFTTPGAARFGADLVVASPNAVYGLFPPALPRELGVVLLAACCTLLVLAARRGDRKVALGAGAVSGLLGVVSVPLFVSSLVWFGATLVMARRREVRTALAWFLASSLPIFLLWLGPVLANFVRFGGFVDITPSLGREWSLPVALLSWGLLLPAAAAGVWACSKHPDAGPLRACLGGTLLLLLLALARGAFDWELAGNATLLHQGRVWPGAHLLAAAFGGAGIVYVSTVLRRYRTIVAGALAPLLLLVGLASPALASLHLARVVAGRHDGFVYGSSEYAAGSFVRAAGAVLDPDSIVQVRGSDRLAFALFQFSGTRLAAYDDPRLEGNDLRIRYADLARRWDERIATGGFEPDYLVVPAADPVAGDEIVSGDFDGVTWKLVSLGKD